MLEADIWSFACGARAFTPNPRAMRGYLSILFASAALAPAIALAQTAAPTVSPDPSVQEVVVTAHDNAGLLERRPSDSVFGIKKPLLETPRSASLASAATLERYGIRDINALTEVSPGAFTDSYYGVAGSLNIRGTLAENYFRGFKRIEDRGTYPTPLGAADRVEIVRGPPEPFSMAPARWAAISTSRRRPRAPIGGYLDQPDGPDVEATLGDYGQARLTGQIGLPAKIGPVTGGVYLYGEVEDDTAYYRGINPKHEVFQGSGDFDLGDGWTTAFGGMIYHSTGAVQTVGWNRLTQALVDHRTYQTGRNTAITDTDGDGRLEPSEIGAPLEVGYFGFPPAPDPRFVLDTGVGTTTLDRRTVFVSNRDFSDTTTQTYYADLAKDLGSGRSAKLQVFYDDLDNKRFVSYGFPADYQAHVWEARASVLSNDSFLGGAIKAQSVAGLSYRYYEGRQRESFNGGYIALDRRDLSYGPTATDIIDDPFSADVGGGGLTWETDIHSRVKDAGVFAQTDVKLPAGFDVTGGGALRRLRRDRAGRRHGGIQPYSAPDLHGFQRQVHLERLAELDLAVGAYALRHLRPYRRAGADPGGGRRAQSDRRQCLAGALQPARSGGEAAPVRRRDHRLPRRLPPDPHRARARAMWWSAPWGAGSRRSCAG